MTAKNIHIKRLTDEFYTQTKQKHQILFSIAHIYRLRSLTMKYFISIKYITVLVFHIENPSDH